MSRSARLILMAAVFGGFALIVPLQHWTDAHSATALVEDEALYLSNGDQVKRLAFGYDALLADVYWMRAIQHFGEKALANRNPANPTRTPPLLLYPLLDVTTTLDPQYIEPYRFGGFFLADFVDRKLAVSLIEKGIAANPDNLSLRLDLGFLYWSTGDCEAASEAYAGGGRIPGAAPWVAQMSAIVLAECGKRDFALRMLQSMYDSTDDPRVREEIEARMKGYIALGEIDALDQAVAVYESRFGAPPQNLELLVRAVRIPETGGVRIRVNASGQPVDPNGEPYVYDPSTRAITTNPESIVLPTIVMKQYVNQSGAK